MPNFTYAAFTQNHERVTGQLAATSLDDAASRLGAGQLTVIKLEEATEATGTPLNRPLSLEDKVFFTQNLATFLASGIPITEAISTTANDAPSKQLRSLLGQVAYDIKSGQTLSASFGRFPATFDPAMLALIEAGEQSGKLAVIFANLTARFRQEALTLTRVKSALMYPAIVVLTLVILGGVLIFFALPKITVVFERFAINLPLITRFLIAVSRTVNSHLWIAISLMVLGTITTGILATLPPIRRWFIAGMGQLPGFRTIIDYLDFERFTATLAILLRAGVPIQTALSVAGRAVTRPSLAREIPVAAKLVAEGKRLADALEVTSLPPMARSLIAAGERSGTLADNLDALERYYHDHLDESLRNFTALIEPILTLAVGLVIGVVVISIIAPIYQLIGQLNVVGQP